MTTHRRRLTSLRMAFLLCLSLLTLAAVASGRQPTYADVPALLGELKSKDASVRAEAAGKLARMGVEAEAAVPVLAELLRNGSRNVRFMAALQLEEYGPEARAAVPALSEALNDKDRDVRANAARALGLIGRDSKEAVPALLKSLRDGDAANRLLAAVALLKIAPETESQITPALLEKAKARVEEDKAFTDGGEGFNLTGGLNFRHGDFDAALADFDKAVKADPKNPRYHLNRGYTLQAQGKPDAAEAAYREALRFAPDSPQLLNNLGYFLVEQDKSLAEALRLIERAVAAQPTNPFFLDSLGWAHFKLGDIAEAERHLDECVRRDGAAAFCHEHLGDLYDRRGDARRAREAWGKALSLSGEAKAIAGLKGKLGGTAKE